MGVSKKLPARVKSRKRVGSLGLDSKVGWVEAGVRLSWVPGPLCSAWCFTLLWINIFLPAYPTRELVGFEGRGVRSV